MFVEKPLAIDRAGVELVRKAVVETGNERLQVGFNRRFAPLVSQIANVFGTRSSPLVMHYRVHAGQLTRRRGSTIRKRDPGLPERRAISSICSIV